MLITHSDIAGETLLILNISHVFYNAVSKHSHLTTLIYSKDTPIGTQSGHYKTTTQRLIKRIHCNLCDPNPTR